MSDWSAVVDNYCERTDPSFWAEPVNALTNAAFLIASVAAFLHWRRAGAHDWPALALIVVAGVVGVGSFLFHTIATRGAALADVIPIAMFIYGYLLLALRRFVKLGWPAALTTLAAFAVGSHAFEAALPRGFLNGSGGYLPALAAMLIVGGLARYTAAGRGVLCAAAVFAVSLVFRIVDHDVCAAFPLGTHFVWHTLNALVLYILLRAAMAGAPARQSLVA